MKVNFNEFKYKVKVSFVREKIFPPKIISTQYSTPVRRDIYIFVKVNFNEWKEKVKVSIAREKKFPPWIISTHNSTPASRGIKTFVAFK